MHICSQCCIDFLAFFAIQLSNIAERMVTIKETVQQQ